MINQRLFLISFKYTLINLVQNRGVVNLAGFPPKVLHSYTYILPHNQLPFPKKRIFQ